MGPGRRFHGCRAVLSLSGEAVELAKLLTSRMMPTVVVATVGPTPQIHRLWSTALALDKGLVRHRWAPGGAHPWSMKYFRYRVDGVLHEAQQLPRNIQNGVVSRLKVMAEMNIAEHRLPQDGRITTKVDGRPVDLRVATLPSVHGEKVVMRVRQLQRQAQPSRPRFPP